MNDLSKFIRTIPDYPKPGIMFKDITRLLANSPVFNAVIEVYANHYKNEKIDIIAGPEARGLKCQRLLGPKFRKEFIIMKVWIVNRKITVLTFAVMFLIYGIVSFGYAHNADYVHFEEVSTTRSVTAGAAIGTNVGEPVLAHSFGAATGGALTEAGHFPGHETSGIFYTLSGTDSTLFSVGAESGQLTTLALLDATRTSYAVTVSIELVKEDGRVEDEESISVTINVESEASEADALQTVSSEERSRIAAALAMDRVIFNELRNATTDTHDWVELRNVSEADVTLDGWEVRIVTDDGTGIVTLPPGTVLPAGGLLLLVNTDPDAPEMPLSTPEG
ncbi:MAG: hypothetical protein OXI63_09385, partial [Candidatus Poribacteria bacterium]|nr:hypothetical protein [Candidatus Poribacteria bacterium]